MSSTESTKINHFELIKSKVTIEQTANLLGMKLIKRGKDLFSQCPYPDHTEKSPSFTLGGSKDDKFYCFGCGRFGDIFDLTSIVLSMDKQQSLIWLAEQSGHDIKTSGYNAKNFKNPPPLPPKNKLPQVTEPEIDYFDSVLYDEIYNALLEGLSLDGYGKSNLSARGLDVDVMFRAGYRNLHGDSNGRIEIATRLAQKFKLGDDRRVAGFFKISKGKWTFSGNRDGNRKVFIKWNERDFSFQVPGLIFPARSADGRIQYLKLRNPDFPFEKIGLTKEIVFNWKTTNDPKYDLLAESLKYFPPKYQVVSSVNRTDGCSARLNTHFSKLSGFSFDKFILTEGELKSDVAASLLNFPVAALAGVNLHHDKVMAQILNTQVDQLSPDLLDNPLRLKSLAELYDETSHNYKAFNLGELFQKIPSKSVLLAFDRDNSKAVENSLYKFKIYSDLYARSGVNFYVLFWNENEAKGFDDLLLSDHCFSCLSLDEIWK